MPVLIHYELVTVIPDLSDLIIERVIITTTETTVQLWLPTLTYGAISVLTVVVVSYWLWKIWGLSQLATLPVYSCSPSGMASIPDKKENPS